MQEGINIEAIKQYNNSLRAYKEKSAKLQAEIEFSQNELERQCKELSAELGIEVTPDNIEQILNEKVEKINKTIALGTEILDRIRAEEGSVQVQQNQFIPPVPNTPVTPMAQAAQAGATVNSNLYSTAPTPPPAPSMSPSGISDPFAGLSGDLPPIFSQGPKI